MSDSLAEDVLKRHVQRISTLHGPVCAYDCKGDMPCDAYRLAVMVREVEAEVERVQAHKCNRDCWTDEGCQYALDLIAPLDILAITRAVSP